ncbi:MAG: putative porin, partial [Ginsengibacter sp.]
SVNSATRNSPDTSGNGSGFERRDDLADSITISYRYLDSLKTSRLDSSLNDFNRYFSIPAQHITLGNNGSAAYPLLFTPQLKAGWDAGFHQYDAYRFTLEGTRFYKTTRPFTQLTYLLASGKEQMIKVLHTQNIKPTWNFGFDYRLISAPGFFKTQNTNHNNYRLFTNYQGPKKRYGAYLVLVGNKLTASENGGIRSDTSLNQGGLDKLYSVPVNLGGDASFSFSVFSTKILTGNIYKDFTFFLRQNYDFGKKDSVIINDSTTDYLFYPRFRFLHTLTSNSFAYQFKDTLSSQNDALLDSAYFKIRYDTTLNPSDGLGFYMTDKWRSITNDFSIRQFPDIKNPAQFVEAGLRVENYVGTFDDNSINFLNIAVHGEYRNKTRNKKWDAIAKGEFYVTGKYAADYSAFASLTRTLSSKLGDVEIQFQNVNRTPSFIYNPLSSFNYKNSGDLKKENIIILSAAAKNSFFNLWFRNISLTNYAFFKSYFQTDQYSALINIIQFQASKTFKIAHSLRLYSDAMVQQTDGSSPVRVPLFYTRQQLAFEGLYFKNLNLSTGLDIRYYTPYKMYNYSPVMGQFFPQDSVSIKNRPDVAAFFHFRIKSFTGFVRLENLNTISFDNGFGFTKYNFSAPNYPTPGLLLRLGVQWNFVN